MNILQIRSSVRGDASHSTRLAQVLVQRLKDQTPGATVVVRDLVAAPHPALDEAALGALFTAADRRTPAQAARVALDDALIAELQAADAVVIGVPMYNLGVPVQLKHWIDAVARAGVTFRYTEKGPEGLVKGKKVFVVLARGGIYRDTAADSQVPYLRSFFGLIGVTDLQFIFAEGLNMGPEAERDGLASAEAQIDGAVAAAPTARLEAVTA